MNAQIEQLRKEIADKQKQLETLEQFTYEKGQLVYVEVCTGTNWIIEFCKFENNCLHNLFATCINSGNSYPAGVLEEMPNITTHRLATEADINRLPDGHKWKPKKLPTNIEEICSMLKPSWYLAFTTNEILKGPTSPSSSSTKQNAERVRAYNNLLNVIEWGNREWPDDKKNVKSCWGLPEMNAYTFNHIKTYFSNDLQTFQS